MSRSLCPDCGANRGLATYNDKSYCFSCHKLTGYKSLFKFNRKQNTIDIPNDLDCNLPSNVLAWLRQYYITDEHITKHNIKWSPGLQRIVFLYNDNKSAWARSIKVTRNKWLHLGKKEIKYIIYKHQQEFNERVAIVEDVISAIRVGDYITCIANEGTSISNDLSLGMGIKAVTWFDGDLAGRVAAEKFRYRYKLFMDITNIESRKDPKCHTPTEMREILNEKI
jgi:hypothetical protein